MYESYVTCSCIFLYYLVYCFYSLPQNLPPSYKGKQFQINYFLSMQYTYENSINVKHFPLHIISCQYIQNKIVLFTPDLLDYSPNLEGIQHKSKDNINIVKSENKIENDMPYYTSQTYFTLQYKQNNFCTLYLFNLPYTRKSIINGLIYFEEELYKTVKVVQTSIGLFYDETSVTNPPLKSTSDCLSECHILTSGITSSNIELNIPDNCPSSCNFSLCILLYFS